MSSNCGRMMGRPHSGTCNPGSADQGSKPLPDRPDTRFQVARSRYGASDFRSAQHRVARVGGLWRANRAMRIGGVRRDGHRLAALARRNSRADTACNPSTTCSRSSSAPRVRRSTHRVRSSKTLLRGDGDLLPRRTCALRWIRRRFHRNDRSLIRFVGSLKNSSQYPLDLVETFVHGSLVFVCGRPNEIARDGGGQHSE